MNTEELEQSLRTEFESYLKAVVAEMHKETTEFKGQIEAEFQRHKEQFDEAFTAFAARFETEHQFDPAFTSSVGEHLRLAVDEGANIAATAMAEAEKLSPPAEVPPPAPAPLYDRLRDAVNDISSKDSQSTILKSLVQHAAEFASRGAFFIIKNEHFVGWRVFGDHSDDAESAIRDIQFPNSSDSILSTAVGSLTSVEGTSDSHTEDSVFLEPLHFGRPERMYAVPLVARGRGVAVLYADQAENGQAPNLEALEMLVRVAGLTVELQASAQAARVGMQAAADFEEAGHDAEEPTPEATPNEEADGFAFSESVSFEGGLPQEVETTPLYEAEPIADSPFTTVEGTQAEFFSESPFSSVSEPDTEVSEPVATETFEYQSFNSGESDDAPAFADPIETVVEEEMVEESIGAEPAFAEHVEPQTVEETEPPVAFETESSPFASAPFETSAAEYAPAGVPSGGFEPAVETVMETPAPVVPKARLSDRPVDLPIEVPEEERRSHNDARRFARLLVSEIKLYNEKRVTEGREASDLYERLREAIDRSREMYDKRVQPPVAAKFDYFHYELVNSLADGDDGRLGTGYPGATV